MIPPTDESKLVLDAVAFAARAHRHQTRKDGSTPYASHVFRVCLIIRHVFGVSDPRILAAALLHDTIEDTTTDYDDIAERFGAEVADWVALLSKDSRLPEAERESAYIEQVRSAPWQVQLCKLGDIYDNLMDSVNVAAEQRQRTVAKCRTYLEVIGKKPPPEIGHAFALVKQKLNEIAACQNR